MEGRPIPVKGDQDGNNSKFIADIVSVSTLYNHSTFSPLHNNLNECHNDTIYFKDIFPYLFSFCI